MGNWRMNCKYAPLKIGTKHCLKDNEGNCKDKKKSKLAKKELGTNKGYFGCAKGCRYFEEKVVK